MSDSKNIINHLNEAFLGYPASKKSDILDSQFSQGLNEMIRPTIESNRLAVEINQRMSLVNGRVNNVSQAKIQAPALTNTLARIYTMYGATNANIESNDATNKFRKR